MHAIYLNGTVNAAMINYLFERFVSGKTKVIYLNTNGEDLSAAFYNNRLYFKILWTRQRFDTYCKWKSNVSRHMDILLEQMQKRILPATIGLIHRIASTITVMTNGEGRNDDEYYRKRLEEVWSKKDEQLMEVLKLKKKEKKSIPRRKRYKTGRR